jgi:hypothetical protein
MQDVLYLTQETGSTIGTFEGNIAGHLNVWVDL